MNTSKLRSTAMLLLPALKRPGTKMRAVKHICKRVMLPCSKLGGEITEVSQKGYYVCSIRKLLTSSDLLLFSTFPELDSGIFVTTSFRLLFISKKPPYASGAYTNVIVQLLSFSETRERLFYFPTILLESKLQPAIFHWQHFKTKGMRKK